MGLVSSSRSATENEVEMSNQPVGLEFMVVEVLLKLTALERMLVKRGIIKSDEFVAEIKAISEQIVAAGLQAAIDIDMNKENNNETDK